MGFDLLVRYIGGDYLKIYAKYLIFSTIIGLVMMGYAFHNEAIQEPAAAQIERNLKQEYDLIPVFPEASLIKSKADHKSTNARVGSTFSTKLEFEDICKFYDKELVSKGWKFLKETKKILKYNENNYELRTLYYLKGDYMVWIENPGMFDKMETFGFYVTWGLIP